MCDESFFFYFVTIYDYSVIKVFKNSWCWTYIIEIESNLQIGPESITKFGVHIQNLQKQMQEISIGSQI